MKLASAASKRFTAQNCLMLPLCEVALQMSFYSTVKLMFLNCATMSIVKLIFLQTVKLD